MSGVEHQAAETIPLGSESDSLAPEIHPFPGLRPFREEEAHLFFGREGHRRELLKRLTATRFVAVVGTSGSGKSSLIRAGLLPDLYSGYLPKTGSDWVIIDISPGTDPIGRLAQTFSGTGWTTSEEELRTNSTQILELASRHLESGQHVLILVDQFEELFRLPARDHPVADHDEKASFVRLLLQAGGQTGDRLSKDARSLHVMIAMRSEFLGRASTFRGLPEAIDQGQYLIPRLSREQLRKAIECPVHVADGEIEEALIQRLLSELGDDQDQLPILQHALMRTWDYKRAHPAKTAIDDECYTHSGGLENALSNDATEILESATKDLGPEGERIVKRAFQSLRETDVNGGQTRRPTTAQDLCEIAECDLAQLTKALKPFRQRSFVLPPVEIDVQPANTIDVSHEALLRRWTTLKGWIEEDDRDRRLYLRIATRAAEEKGSTNPDYFAPPLLGVLQEFWANRQPTRRWAIRHHPGYEDARDFLIASGANQDAADKAAAKRTWLRQLMGVTIALLVGVLLLVGVWLWRSSQTADLLASQAALLASQVVAAKAANTADSDIETRIQLAADALRRQPDLDTQRLLLASIFSAAKPLPEIRVENFTDDPRIAVLSGKGDFVVVASESEVMALDAVTGARTWHVEMTGEQAFIAQTSDGGRVFLSGNPLRVLDAATGQDLATVAVANLSAFAVAYDGDRMAVSGDQMILTCHLSMRCSDLTRHPDPNSTEFLHLSPDGELLVALESPDESGTALATLYETSKWMMVKQRRLDSGDDILAASLDSFDLRLCSSAKLTSFDTYDNSLDKADETPFTTEVNACQFSGDRVVTLNGDHALRVWADNGSLVALAPARGNEAAVSFAGVRIAALDERRIKFWEVNRYGRPFNLPAFSTLESDGSHAVVGKQIVNLESGAATSFEPPADSKVAAVRAIAASHRTAVFWQRTTAQLIFAERHEIGAVVERWHVPVPDTSTGTAKPGSRRTPVVSISRDERFITVTTGPTGVWILDARNGAVVLRVANASQPVFVPARDEFIARQVTRGGRVLAAWPLPQGSPRDLSKTEGLGSGQTSAIAFSNDGTLFATAEAASDEETASGKRAWNVRVWEWPGLTVRRDLLHTAPVTSLTFGSDARTLLTATNSTTTIHAWDLETGEEFLRAPYTSSTLSRAPSMAFTPNRQLAFSDSLGVTVVPTETSQWIHEGCERITRNLSPEEWTLLVGVNVAYQKTCPNRP